MGVRKSKTHVCLMYPSKCDFRVGYTWGGGLGQEVRKNQRGIGFFDVWGLSVIFAQQPSQRGQRLGPEVRNYQTGLRLLDVCYPSVAQCAI